MRMTQDPYILVVVSLTIIYFTIITNVGSEPLGER